LRGLESSLLQSFFDFFSGTDTRAVFFHFSNSVLIGAIILSVLPCLALSGKAGKVSVGLFSCLADRLLVLLTG
jgi:hypothetical protein